MLSPIGNKRVKSKKDQFCKLVAANKEKRWFVCSHDNPDPDSLGSCLGVVRILNFLGVENVEIIYCGEISHPQNRAMQNILQLRVKKWENGEDTSEDMFIFVDCSYNQKNMSIKKIPNVVIDHHKISTSNKDVLYVHDEVGACSSLVLDLALGITKQADSEEGTEQCFDPDEEGNKELATALAIGIKTDTIDFLSEATTNDDIQAFRFLARHLSDEKFNSIVNYEYPPYVLDYEQIAWKNKGSDYTPHLITGLEFVDEPKSDCIPAIADKFMRIAGVQTAVVYAVVNNTIRASIRTSSAALDCQSLCDEVFGKGNGGSKHGIGGARVQFNVFDPSSMNEEDRNSLWKLVQSQIEGKFSRATTK